jgi:hypothetical protein
MKSPTVLLLPGFLVGCASSQHLTAPSMAPLVETLQVDHFKGDESHRITDQALREILAAPVVLEEGARVGVVPVTGEYAADTEVPLTPALAQLSSALKNSASFEVVTEVSTGWPTAAGIAGLRELAARYRTEYLLLYRHRFIDDSSVNAWAAFYPTVLGALFVPSNTLRAAGVMEATLFDVKSGTIIFTSFERVSGNSEENVWQNDRKMRVLREQLVKDGAEKLGKDVEQQLAALSLAKTKSSSQADQPQQQ